MRSLFKYHYVEEVLFFGRLRRFLGRLIRRFCCSSLFGFFTFFFFFVSFFGSAASFFTSFFSALTESVFLPPQPLCPAFRSTSFLVPSAPALVPPQPEAAFPGATVAPVKSPAMLCPARIFFI